MRFFLGLVAVWSLIVSIAVTVPFVQPTDRPRDVVAALKYLRTVDPAPMQQLFPEGEFFTAALTGLAAGNLATRGDLAPAEAERHIRRALDVVNRPQVRDRFGLAGESPPTGIPHGIFYRGWRLLLLVELAKLAPATTADMKIEAELISQSLTQNALPASYPGGNWPCDAVVAMAAVRRADVVAPMPTTQAVTSQWIASMKAYVDPATGLLVHRAAGSRGAAEQPRATSSALIAAFLPDINEGWARDYYARVRSTLMDHQLGMVGIREYPRGVSGAGDEDSGPLIAGVSLSASAVTLAAARRQGDAELICGLDGQAELLGLPMDWGQGRRYWFGQLPVGDAFLAWARSYPTAVTVDHGDTPSTWWPALTVLTLLPGALAGWGLWVPTKRRRRGRASTPAL